MDKSQKTFLQLSMMQTSGLPNLGNTCFLNSIIQSLFPLALFRKKVIEAKQHTKNKIVKALGNIFNALQKVKSMDQKQSYMKQLINGLVSKNFDYSGGSQEDSTHFLLLILKQLSKQDPKFMDYFNIIIVQYCSNSQCCQFNKKQKIPQIFLQKQDQICSECTVKKNKIALINPQYLIIFGGDRDQSFELMDPEQQKKFYKVQAKILYSGDGRFGHYICKRKLFKVVQNKECFEDWRIYNDSKISKQVNYYQKNFKVICSIYSLFQKQNTQVLKTEIIQQPQINSENRNIQEKEKEHSITNSHSSQEKENINKSQQVNDQIQTNVGCLGKVGMFLGNWFRYFSNLVRGNI